MSKYAKGRRFEYEVKKALKKEGFFVIRASASKGIFDIIGIKDNEIKLIQCQVGKGKKALFLPFKEKLLISQELWRKKKRKIEIKKKESFYKKE